VLARGGLPVSAAANSRSRRVLRGSPLAESDLSFLAGQLHFVVPLRRTKAMFDNNDLRAAFRLGQASNAA
jgi:hypothetical protein